MSARCRILLAGLALLIVVPTLRAQEASPPADSQPAAVAGTLRIRNASFPSLRLQVRLDGGQGCDQGSSLANPPLQQGRSISLTTSQTVCWRREANPGSGDEQWTAWRRFVPGSSSNAETVL